MMYSTGVENSNLILIFYSSDYVWIISSLLTGSTRLSTDSTLRDDIGHSVPHSSLTRAYTHTHSLHHTHITHTITIIHVPFLPSGDARHAHILLFKDILITNQAWTCFYSINLSSVIRIIIIDVYRSLVHWFIGFSVWGGT